MIDISIIIPTLNESKYIEGTLHTVLAHKTKSIEVIVIDCNSRDDTVSLVQEKVDLVHIKPEFKGYKYKSLNYGASLATGEILLFLDADCCLPVSFDQLILSVMTKNQVVGGAFEFKVGTGGGLAYKLLELVNRMRYRFSKLYYGDQAVFCNKAIFDQIGGFPLEPIMESAYLCKKLKSIGKLCLIEKPVISSIRRFQGNGIARVFAYDLKIWIHFVFGLETKRFARKYWLENEKLPKE